LPEEIKARPHIILGRDPKTGEVRYFDRLGALQDFLSWFGLDKAPVDFKEVLNGQKTWREWVKEIAMAPAQKAWQGITPLVKTPAEFITGKSTFPDLTKPRTIRDRAGYIANQLAATEELNALTGRPMRGTYQDSWNPAKMLAYTIDPEESAYYTVQDLKNKYLDSKGDNGYADIVSDQSNALWQLKRAIRFGDTRAIEKYRKEYIRFGGTVTGMATSVRNLDPLHDIKIADREDFLRFIGEDGKKAIEKANRYYTRIRTASASLQFPVKEGASNDMRAVSTKLRGNSGGPLLPPLPPKYPLPPIR
jgi:hypothetical protein